MVTLSVSMSKSSPRITARTSGYSPNTAMKTAYSYNPSSSEETASFRDNHCATAFAIRVSTVS